MLNYIANIIFVIACVINFMSCKSHSSETLDSTSLQSSRQSSLEISQSSQVLDFCNSPIHSDIICSQARVQTEIGSLLDIQDYKKSALSAYAEVYLEMTKARDASRCQKGEKLYSNDIWQRQLNNALADLMTRSFVEGQQACFADIQGMKKSIPVAAKFLCEMSKQADMENWTSLEVAMASTAIYLTDILGQALSALPYIDNLWINTEFISIDQRISALQKFKPTYDAFNEFLSDHLQLVADVLIRSGRVNCQLFSKAAGVAEDVPIPEIVFKVAREKTFELGLQLAKDLKGMNHTLAAKSGFWQPESFMDDSSQAKIPGYERLRNHARNMVKVFNNPLLKVFSSQGASQYIMPRLGFCKTHHD